MVEDLKFISAGIKSALKNSIDFSIYSIQELNEFQKWRNNKLNNRKYENKNSKNLEIFGYTNVYEAGWKKLSLKIENFKYILTGIKEALNDNFKKKYTNGVR